MPGEIKADGFVRPGYQCADERTATWVEEKAKALVGRKAETPKTGPKYVACLADFLRTVQGTPKRLVNALLSKDGPVTRFPRGQNEASFRSEFDIPKHLKVADYLHDIYSALPFLKGFHLDGLELMYRESELMVRSLVQLAEVDVPAYPVHDCLICRRSDEPVVVGVLRQVMKDKFGGVVGLEVEIEGEESRVLVLE